MELPPTGRVGEQIQNWKERANRIEERIYQNIGGNRALAMFAIGLGNISLIAGGVHAIDVLSTDNEPISAHMACGPSCTHVLDAKVIEAPPATPPPAIKTAPPTTEAPPPPVAERVAGIDPTVEANIGNIKLSFEGYKQFLQSVDYSFFDYAQQFVEFNPRKIALPQAPTEFITIHYTAFYRNQDGPAGLPIGKMDPLNFVLGMAIRYDDQNDHKCCGINAVMDREGIAHQFAPVTAKLRHNKGRDGITTGIEFEAASQQQITTVQYEQGAYMMIAMWQSDPGLKGKPFSSIIKGHGETRPEDRIKDPKLDVKTDFSGPPTEWYRRNVQVFLDTHPEVAATPAHLR